MTEIGRRHVHARVDMPQSYRIPDMPTDKRGHGTLALTLTLSGHQPKVGRERGLLG
jgi:hypothetical protein